MVETNLPIRNVKVVDKTEITKLAENCAPLIRASVIGTYEFMARCFKNTFFIYEENSKIIAFIVGFPNTAKQGEFWIYQACICDKYRSQGIGSQLFEKIINQVKSEGYQRMRSHLRFENEHSLNLHKKYGFQICGKDDRGWFVELLLNK